jgi:hypothetical protein
LVNEIHHNSLSQALTAPPWLSYPWMDPSPRTAASGPTGGGHGETQTRLWCHDCRAPFALPATALVTSSSDPQCSTCDGEFVEVLPEASPSGGVHIELGYDASAEDVVTAAREIMRRLAGGEGDVPEGVGTQTSTSFGGHTDRTGALDEPEIAAVAREAWSALLGGNHGFQDARVFNTSFGLAPGGGASFTFGGVGGTAGGLFQGTQNDGNLFDAFGAVNIAELDTRTFHHPASPDAVALLPETIVTDAHFTQENDDRACPVCLGEMENGSLMKTMPCGHRYHKNCLLEWLRTKHSCPVCRVTLPTAAVN